MHQKLAASSEAKLLKIILWKNLPLMTSRYSWDAAWMSPYLTRGAGRGEGAVRGGRWALGESGNIQVLWKFLAAHTRRAAVHSAHFGAKTYKRSMTAGRRRPGAAGGEEEGANGGGGGPVGTGTSARIKHFAARTLCGRSACWNWCW
jgi:hypothetical protein